jgi:HSP20 family molecular chaperone IbpA
MHENRQRLISEMDRLFSEFDRFFEGINPNGRILSPRRHVWMPPTDVYETGEVMVVKIEIAGMREQDFDLAYANGVLTVSGRRQDPSSKLTYHRLEISHGEFMTQVRIPWPVAEDQIQAKYDLGFLFIILPKQRNTMRIPVQMVERANLEQPLSVEPLAEPHSTEPAK